MTATLTSQELNRIATDLCEKLGLNPNDVYRLDLYAVHHRVGRGVIAHIYKRRDGKKYLDDDGEPATEVKEWLYRREFSE